MKYLLDTDHISFLQRHAGNEHAALTARLALHAPSDYAFPIISLQEQAVGAHAYILKARTSGEVVRGYALHALSNGLVLLTRNTVDFGRVPGLETADWTV